MTVRIRMSNARESVLRYEQEADLVAGSLLLWMAGAAIVIAVSYTLSIRGYVLAPGRKMANSRMPEFIGVIAPIAS